MSGRVGVVAHAGSVCMKDLLKRRRAPEGALMGKSRDARGRVETRAALRATGVALGVVSGSSGISQGDAASCSTASV